MESFKRVYAPVFRRDHAAHVDSGNLINAGNGGSATRKCSISPQIDPLRVFVSVPQSSARRFTWG